MPKQTFAEAWNEEGAQRMVYISAVIVIFIALFIYVFGIKIFPLFRRKKLTPKQQLSYFIIICVAIFGIGIFCDLPILSMPAAMLLLVAGLVSKTNWAESAGDNEISHTQQQNSPSPNRLTYYGNTLNFSDEDLSQILSKHLPFYTALYHAEKDIFRSRLKKFIESKVFIINDSSGFREMPILVSAAAIQLTFGLKKYMMPSFPTISIHPAEFIRTEPTICFLIGNVSNNSINISWKHFLEGFKNPTNGENVGLHEMAHAYYYQNFEANFDTDACFTKNFPEYDISCSVAYDAEKRSLKKLYTDYGLTNMQEFWAEGIEIFFEKPVIMQQKYPELYDCICRVLNRQPAAKTATSYL